MLMELADMLKGSFLILGVGNADRGDDGIGNYVVSKLKTQHKLDCGPVPENFTGKIRKTNPKTILIIDAVDFGGEPGQTILAEAEKAEGMTLSTHSLPLSLLCKMLPGSKIYILGIQPENLQAMTEQVKASGNRLAEELNSLLI
jgi:hydrogenase 3 maturation protease